MSDALKEEVFEETIERHLLSVGGARKGDAAAFDRVRGVVPSDVLGYLEEAHPEAWKALQKEHGSGLREAILNAVVAALDTRGTLAVLREGVKLAGREIPWATFRPAHQANPEVLARYAKNRFTLTRQLAFLPNANDTVDLAFFVNGLPIATVELKIRTTSQSFHHAERQYERRDPNAALFRWKARALVHFAVDEEEASMTTRLAGDATEFLPFNRGVNHGAGNPPHDAGHRTAYLWHEVWTRDSFLDILHRFAHVLVEEDEIDGKKIKKEKIVFPRYHQLDAVRLLETTARAEGPGHGYLIQHSAGSGKSNSIAWLTHRLATLYRDDDTKVFDSVVVVTDRRVLDKQLQGTIGQFEPTPGFVRRIDKHSIQLAQALERGAPVIVTTLQKFPRAARAMRQLTGKSYAVIIDEAHSSQGGEAAKDMKRTLGVTVTDDETDPAVIARRMAEARGVQSNLSMFAFTATPKSKTLEVFGRRDKEGNPRPFHLYSMRQAVEEGFIVDVLGSYETYRSFFKLEKTVEGDPEVDKRRAARDLRAMVHGHAEAIEAKTKVMIDHFRRKVAHEMGGRAKAMVVCASRQQAADYKRAFDAILAREGITGIGTLVAFSGDLPDPTDPAEKITEQSMNGGISEGELPKRFATSAYRILIVADKYQTGFDQPLLQTMYVDKRLAGVQAVQTLSRLNRKHPLKTGTFVVDFVNTPDEIRDAFKAFHEETMGRGALDPRQLTALRDALRASGVIVVAEVDAFAAVFFKPTTDEVADQAELMRIAAPAVDRARALDEQAHLRFRGVLKGFISLYAFLAQVVSPADGEMEKLYVFGRKLLQKLEPGGAKDPVDVTRAVELTYYRVDKMSEGNIPLLSAEMTLTWGPSAVGSRKAEPNDVPLSEVVDLLNKRFGDAEHFAAGVKAATEADPDVKRQAAVNSFDNFALAAEDKVIRAVMDQIDAAPELVTALMNDAELRERVVRSVLQQIFGEAQIGEGHPRT